MTTSNVSQFSADLAKFAEAIDLDIKTAVKVVCIEAFRRVVMRSPVDTGRFRSNWTLAEAAPLLTIAPELPKGAPTAAIPAPPAFQLASPYTIVWIANGLPYAERLEFGWSGQAPAGMVRLTAAELTAYVSALARGL